jgi:hypothetical protein
MILAFNSLDFGANVWPWQPGSLQWRFGAVGLFAGPLASLVLGVFLLMAGAWTLKHRRIQRTLAILSALLVVLLLLTMIGFTLDAVQMRASVREESQRPLSSAVVQAGVKYLIIMLALTALSWLAWPASREKR